MTVIQFLADSIDQMDLALDQLATKDRNFDRFALMLIDNVVELILHKNAEDKEFINTLSRGISPFKYEPKLVANALGQYFEGKVRLAKETKMISPPAAESILYLHAFRNTAYHKGVRHEGILHSLVLFYFKNACSILANYKPTWWSWGSSDLIPHRAMKYIGNPGFRDQKERFEFAWNRLREVGDSMGDKLIADLSADMHKTIKSVDENIQFLADNSLKKLSRKKVIIDCQAWPFAFSDEGKNYLSKHKVLGKSVSGYVEWLRENYPWPIANDPIPSWQKRLKSLESEKDNHRALKKYCDFMKQTEGIRSEIENSAGALDSHIQNEIDRARGK